VTLSVACAIGFEKLNLRSTILRDCSGRKTTNFRQIGVASASLKKLMIAVIRSRFFDLRLNCFHTPLSDGLPRKQLFDRLILVNHFDYTTCGWATLE
jgi:hypothetical protein